MSQRFKTTATLGLLLLVLVGVAARQNHWDLRSRVEDLFRPARPQTPEDGVYRMLDAARVGDVSRYLDCFSGGMRTQIEQVIKESTRTKFANYLQSQNKRFTGVAVTVRDKPDGDNVHIRVEYVFRERNEVQDFYLRRENNVWRIVKVVGSEQITTLIPYGTVVTD